MVERRATIEVVAEQEMGSFYVVTKPDGSQETIEVYRPGVPWDRQPPDGESSTSAQAMAKIADQVSERV
jgi:hypothetical protein